MDWPKLAGQMGWPKMDWPKRDWPKSVPSVTVVPSPFGQSNFGESVFGQSFFVMCCCCDVLLLCCVLLLCVGVVCCCWVLLLGVVVGCWCWVLGVGVVILDPPVPFCAKPPCGPPCAGPPYAGPPNISFFFPSPAPIFALFVSLSGCLLVVFLKAGALKCVRLGSPNVHISGLPRFKHHQISTRRHPERDKKSENGKKNEILGPPPFGAPPFGAPPLRAPPFHQTKTASPDRPPKEPSPKSPLPQPNRAQVGPGICQCFKTGPYSVGTNWAGPNSETKAGLSRSGPVAPPGLWSKLWPLLSSTSLRQSPHRNVLVSLGPYSKLLSSRGALGCLPSTTTRAE